ncbi:MAG: hypothetical protein RBR63_10545 [Methanosarcina vacuolata]|nr:hypothetical protein [Methanosarcina vacuolata]
MAAPSGIRDFSMSVPTANSAIRIFIGKEKLGNLFITFCSKPFQKRLERKPQEPFEYDNLVPNPYRRDHNPFQKRLDRNPFQKRLDRKPQEPFELITLSPNPIGVINRRNGFGKAIF